LNLKKSCKTKNIPIPFYLPKNEIVGTPSTSSKYFNDEDDDNIDISQKKKNPTSFTLSLHPFLTLPNIYHTFP